MSHERPHPGRRVAPVAFRAVRRSRDGAAVRVRALAFWLAVCLPWLLLGLSLVGSVGSEPGLFVALVVSTALCAFVGRHHAR